MAQAVEVKRQSAAAKLRDSVRQLRRYLEQENLNERIIVLKSDKVDVDREELIAKHHMYAEKSSTSLDDEQMREYIEGKIDDAVDAVDEANARIDEMRAEATEARGTLELAASKLRATSVENVINELVTRINALVIKEEPTSNDARSVEALIVEMTERGLELTQPYESVKLKLKTNEEIQVINDQEEVIQSNISQKRAEANSFILRLKAENDSDTRSEAGSERGAASTQESRSNQLRVKRMGPPVFSGKIRDYARFKGDFENMVERTYTEETDQVCIIKEECLKGEALNIVRNLATMEEIWARLTEKYGDTTNIVESILKELEAITITGSNQDQSLIKLIETLESGIQDLDFIGKKHEIANLYTVKILEKKLPKRVLTRWYEKVQEDEDNRDVVVPPDRFVSMLAFLKSQRKVSEKLVQQSQDKGQGSRDEEYKRKQKDKKLLMLNKTGNAKGKCIIHPEATHLTRRCSEYLGKSKDDRATLVKELNACKLCFSVSHVGSECPWKSKWQPCCVENCTEYHSRTLHGNTVLNMHLQASAKCESVRVLLLMQEIPDGIDKAFTFWDNGIMISLVSRQYARKRKLVGVSVCYDLTTVNNVTTTQQTLLYHVPIENRKGETVTIKAYEIETICDDVAFFSERVKELFKNLNLKEVARPRASVDLLIGAEYEHSSKTKQNQQKVSPFQKFLWNWEGVRRKSSVHQSTRIRSNQWFC